MPQHGAPSGPPQVPGYVLGPPVGFGATGPVWSARTGRGHRVVVSVLSVPVGERGEAYRRRLAALSSAHHRHLAEVVEVVPLGADRCAVVSEEVAGPSLATVLAARRWLPAQELAEVGRDVGSALAHLHEHGVVHGDVSPANVLIARGGRPVLVDLAGEVSAERGTPGFVAPEREIGAPASPAGDVWALARVLQWCAPADESIGEVLTPALAPDPRVRPAAPDLARAWAALGDPQPVGVPTAADLAQARLRSGDERTRPTRSARDRGRRHRRRPHRPRPILVVATAAAVTFALGGAVAAVTDVLQQRPGAATTLGATELHAVVAGLLDRRDHALRAGDGEALAQLTVPGTAVAEQDARLSAALSGIEVEGLRTEVREVREVGRRAGRWVVEATVVQQPHSRTSPSSPAASEVAGQPPRCVRLELTGPAPWRVAGAHPCALSD